MYQPILAGKFHLRRFCIESDRKKRAVLMSMVLEQFGNYINPKQNIVFQNHLFSNYNSFKFMSPIVAVAAAAAAATIG